MKKLLAIALVLVLALALTGCSMLMGTPQATTADTTAGAAAETADAAEADATASGGLTSNSLIGGSGLFNWFQLALAVYMLYAVITGRGKLFENQYTKCDYKKYKRIMRIMCAVAGVILLASSILEMTKVVTVGTVWGWVLWGVGFASIIAVAVFNVVMTDRKAAAAAAKYGTPETPKDPLRAAFVFDEDEEKPAADNNGQNADNKEENGSGERPQ